MADSVIPLCTWPQFTSGAFADLARNYTDATAQNDLMIEATRLVEQATTRRLAPFTGMVESHRAQGVDPDEFGGGADLPLDLPGVIGRSYANALGSTNLIRHCWLNEFAPRNQELWTYSDVAVTVVRSYGGSQVFTATQVVGPEPDSGHVWFNLGAFVPVGSLIRATYSGGYTVAVPADLVRATKFMAAWLVVRELQPNHQTRDPELLRADAEQSLLGYLRE